jgi:hypothetical protein
MNLDPAPVLGADVPVLAGADEPGRGAVVTVEGRPVETVGNQRVVVERVVDSHDRPDSQSRPSNTT